MCLSVVVHQLLNTGQLALKSGWDVIDLDGLKGTPWYIERRGLCVQLVSTLAGTKRLLIRGPFASGKTSLAQLLHFLLEESRCNAYIITLAGSEHQLQNLPI